MNKTNVAPPDKGKKDGKACMPPKSDEIYEDIYVLNGQVRLLHPLNGGFRTSLDTVLVAAAVPVDGVQTVLDLGCGVGGAAFCVLNRCSCARMTGIDIQSDLIHLARLAMDLNDVQDRAEFIVGDILNLELPDQFDHVLCNPPFLAAGTYTPSPDQSRGLALGHHAQTATLEDWLRVAHKFLKSRGTLTMIHRADHLDDIVHGLGNRFGNIEIIPLWPHAGEPAKRVIIRAVKDKHGGTTIHPGIVLHKSDGSWTDVANTVLRDGHGIMISHKHF